MGDSFQASNDQNDSICNGAIRHVVFIIIQIEKHFIS